LRVIWRQISIASNPSISPVLNIEYPPAKHLRRSFGALAKAEVLYGGQVEQEISNDEVFLYFDIQNSIFDILRFSVFAAPVVLWNALLSVVCSPLQTL
jgi:hypothetical protein